MWVVVWLWLIVRVKEHKVYKIIRFLLDLMMDMMYTRDTETQIIMDVTILYSLSLKTDCELSVNWLMNWCALSLWTGLIVVWWWTEETDMNWLSQQTDMNWLSTDWFSTYEYALFMWEKRVRIQPLIWRNDEWDAWKWGAGANGKSHYSDQCPAMKTRKGNAGVFP